MQAARGASLTTSDHVTGPPARRGRLRAVFVLIAVGALALDQATKQWAVAALPDGDRPVLGDWLVLHLTFNPGAAFSTGTEFTVVFTCLAIVAVLVISWLSLRLGSAMWTVALGVLLGGVGGNLVDRLFRDPEPFHGHVVDFLMVPHWPVFNVADICINVAAGLIVLQTLRGVGLDGTRESRA